MNPIMQRLNNASGPLQNLMNLKALAGGNPQAAFNMLMQSNPDFKKFVQANQGKSPEEIARAYGIDLNQINNLLK